VRPRFSGPTLSLSKNAPYHVAIRTAVEHHVPPTVYLPCYGRHGRTVLVWNDEGYYEFDEMPQDYRTPLDRAIEVGWQFYQDAICPKCGVPWWYGRSTDSRVQFEVEEDMCYSCFEADTKRNKQKETKPGITDRVVPVGVYYEAIDEWEELPSPLELVN